MKIETQVVKQIRIDLNFLAKTFKDLQSFKSEYVDVTGFYASTGVQLYQCVQEIADMLGLETRLRIETDPRFLDELSFEYKGVMFFELVNEEKK